MNLEMRLAPVRPLAEEGPGTGRAGEGFSGFFRGRGFGVLGVGLRV